MKRFPQYVLLILGLCVAAAFVTWPHAKYFGSSVVSNIDPLLSMWRLAWFAHAIQAGVNLLNANIFVHETYLKPGELSRLLLALLANTEFTPLGRYRDWIGPTDVFEVAGPWKGTWRNDDRDVQLH